MMKVGCGREIVLNGWGNKGVRRHLRNPNSGLLVDRSLWHREKPTPLVHPVFVHPPLTRETGCPHESLEPSPPFVALSYVRPYLHLHLSRCLRKSGPFAERTSTLADDVIFPSEMLGDWWRERMLFDPMVKPGMHHRFSVKHVGGDVEFGVWVIETTGLVHLEKLLTLTAGAQSREWEVDGSVVLASLHLISASNHTYNYRYKILTLQ